MSAPTNVDFKKGIDFAGINPGTAADHNTLVDAARPFAEANPIEGKGLFIVTINNFDGTPCVPDAISTNQNWRRNIWVRVDYNSAAKRIAYIWNDSKAPDATYLKWEEFGSTTDLQAAIDAIEIDIIALQAAQANLATQLNATAAIANAAAADAASALAAVPDISALTTAVTITLPAADTANAAASALAQTTANTALTNANLALAQSNLVAANRFYQTADYAFAASSLAINEVHGLGGVPHWVRFVMICQTAELGYAIGDEVDNSDDFTISSNATNICASENNSATHNIFHKTTGVLTNITNANWKIRMYAWRG